MSETPLPTTAPPQTVRVSALLYVIGAVIGLIGAVVSLITLPAVIDAARRQAAVAVQGQNTNGVDVSAATSGIVIGGVVFSVVLTIVFSVLTILFARRMRNGRNWARIVLAVFAALQIFGAGGAFGVGAIHFLVVLAALILSFLPTSNAWFREVKAGAAPAV